MTLKTEISKINRLSKEHAAGLKKLKINNIEDLLNYFPVRYSDEREAKNIQNLNKGDTVSLFGEIRNLQIKRSFKGHIPMCEGKLVDNTGSIKLVWFHQAYIAKMYNDGEFVKVQGIVQEKNGVFSLLNPDIERVSRDHIYSEDSLFSEVESSKSLKEMMPVYKETKGLSSNYLRSLIKKVLANKELRQEILNSDPLPESLLKSLSLPSLDKAYLYIHLPKAKDIKKAEEMVLVSRKRFSFEEIFYLQLLKQSERKKAKESISFNLNISVEKRKELIKEYIAKVENRFKFKLTGAQSKAIQSISKDLNKKEPMGRLLEGDVGSGKTLVAAIISYFITHYENRDLESGKRLQVAIMAPTEILATQHFDSFIDLLKDEKVEIGLLTGKICKKYPSKVNVGGSTNISKAMLKKMVEKGDISIVIGTHALIQKTLSFQNLALAIIDEQHRFGVKQRALLASKKSVSTKVMVANDIKNLTNKKQKIIKEKEKLPHLLSMTATPIPRTLALTIFGDLDLTILDELPKNRKKIITKIEKEKDRENVYKEILKEIKAGYQAYIVVPRIEELDEEEQQSKGKLNLRSVESEVKNLEEFFNIKNKANIKIFGMHSKIKKEEKEKIMQDFANNKIQVLVSTSVIEVGVNVPNASRMIIEGAERFGLAQLHQLRGRIGRGERESVCYLFTNSSSDITLERLSSLLKAKNGFELAELDLNQRGIGSLLSGKQWGVSDLAMEAIKNLKLVEITKEEAKKLIEIDPELKKHKKLKKVLEEKEKVHME